MQSSAPEGLVPLQPDASSAARPRARVAASSGSAVNAHTASTGTGQTSMPATAPGSLTPEQVADVVSHLLNMSKYPAGATALASKMEALLQIKIDAPK